MSVIRDAALAAVTGVLLVGALVRAEALDALATGDAIAVGVGVGILVEAAFLADPTLGAAWDRRWVPPLAGIALVVAAVAATRLLGAVVLAAAVWGVATYFAVLAVTLLGRLATRAG